VQEAHEPRRRLGIRIPEACHHATGARIQQRQVEPDPLVPHHGAPIKVFGVARDGAGAKGSDGPIEPDSEEITGPERGGAQAQACVERAVSWEVRVTGNVHDSEFAPLVNSHALTFR
jgi:hypothetical protein